MATGGGHGIRNTTFAPPNTRNNNNFDDNRQNRLGSDSQQRSNDPDEMTRRVVDEFKKIVQNKTQQGQRIAEPVIELEIANIKRRQDPDQYDKVEWKRRLPHNVQNCSDAILLVSMAYGNTPNEVETVLEAKMNQMNLNDVPTDTSLQNVTRPLKNLKKDLDENPLSNLFHAVRNIDDRYIERADRLFYSEALHLVPGLKEYTYEDAHNAVQAIRTTNAEINTADQLLPLLKICRSATDISQFIEDLPKRPSIRPEPTTAPSRIVDEDHRAQLHAPTERRNPNYSSQAPNFPIRPPTNRNAQPPQPSERPPPVSDPRQREGSTGGYSRVETSRK